MRIYDGEITESEPADRSDASRRCLIAQGDHFGVGQTFMALAILARARQEGWRRSSVIYAPASMIKPR